MFSVDRGDELFTVAFPHPDSLRARIRHCDAVASGRNGYAVFQQMLITGFAPYRLPVRRATIPTQESRLVNQKPVASPASARQPRRGQVCEHNGRRHGVGIYLGQPQTFGVIEIQAVQIFAVRSVPADESVKQSEILISAAAAHLPSSRSRATT